MFSKLKTYFLYSFFISFCSFFAALVLQKNFRKFSWRIWFFYSFKNKNRNVIPICIGKSKAGFFYSLSTYLSTYLSLYAPSKKQSISFSRKKAKASLSGRTKKQSISLSRYSLSKKTIGRSKDLPIVFLERESRRGFLRERHLERDLCDLYFPYF